MANSATRGIVDSYKDLASRSQSSAKTDPEKNRAVGLLIAAMAGHFYKDDVAPEQIAMKTIDFCLDLADYTTTEIQSAFTNYRQDSKNKTFPRPGQIRDLCGHERADRLAASRPRPVLDSRPMRWWDRPKDRWEPNWLEGDVPQGERVRDAVGAPWRMSNRYGT
jgi:hypothetical protein